MKEQDLDALIISGQAMPGGMGGIRYITHAHLWGGVAYAILGADDPWPWLHVWSSYQAVWSRNETTTLPERVLYARWRYCRQATTPIKRKNTRPAANASAWST